MATNFFWYELMTTDVPAAEAFYKAVVGWSSEPFPMDGPPYIVVKVGERGVGGIMEIPAEAKAMGAGPGWLGYIRAADTDAATESVGRSGGAVQRPPEDIPNVGRFSVVADPQGGTFMFLAPMGPDQPPVDPATPGHIGWHELYTSDWPAALAFYSGQFGWAKGDSFEMGEMGTYQLFTIGGQPVGGMMNKPDPSMPTGWLFYFNVTDIDAGAGRITDNGGSITMGPTQVPGGQWIVMATDPQGAAFALLAPATA